MGEGINGRLEKTLPNHKMAFVEGLSEAFKDANKPIVDAINNLANNTGNKTTREYNELKTKYKELEENFINVDSLLRTIVTLYTLSIIKHNQGGFIQLNSDNIIRIIDEDHTRFQESQNSPFPDVLCKSMYNTANEVYEKLRKRGV